MRKLLLSLGLAAAAVLPLPASALVGYADVVVEFFDSGVGPLADPYGGEYPGGIGYPVAVPTSVVLGNDPGPNVDFLSLPTGSFVTVRFTDEVIIDSPGNDIFIQEVGVGGEDAEVYVSSDGLAFTLLGIAQDDVTTSLDLGSIGFAGQVRFIKIVGLDNGGSSPGFDVVNVQGLPGSVRPTPAPATLLLAGAALAAAGLMRRRR